MARQAQWAFFGAQVAANPPAFAANISWGRDGVGDVASAKIDLSAPLPLQFIFGWLGDSSDHNASDAVCHKEALDSGWIHLPAELGFRQGQVHDFGALTLSGGSFDFQLLSQNGSFDTDPGECR
jgi:hypothetical protein